MRKKLKIITLLMLMTSVMSLYAQENHWTAPESTTYAHSSLLCIAVYLDDEPQNAKNIEIAAFYGDEVRGVAKPLLFIPGVYTVQLTVYSNKIGEYIRFKIYDHDKDEEFVSDYYIEFVEDGAYGDLLSPVRIDFYASPFDYPAVTDDNLTVTWEVNFNEVVQKNDRMQLAAYCGEDLRGFAKLQYELDYQNVPIYMVSMFVYGKAGDKINFKLFDPETGLVYDAAYELNFEADLNIGTDVEPYFIDFYGPQNVTKNVYYRTLSEAVSYADAGNEIKIAANITDLNDYDGGLGIDKDLTLNFNGKEYNINGLNVSSALTIKGTPVNYSIPFIKLSGAGQVINETSFNTTIKKEFAGYGTSPDEGDQWHTISSPVGTVQVDEVENLLSEGYDLYQYDEPTMHWLTYIEEGSIQFADIEKSRGYLYANPDTVELCFRGTLSTNDESIDLKNSGNTLAGFNLVGNPYSHNISFAHLSGPELVQGYYVLSNEGSWGAVLGNGEADIIAPCQGALIKTTATENLTLKISKNVNTKGAKSESNGSIAVSLSNERYSDITYVSFSEGEGLVKINHHNVNAPMLYIPVNNTNYAIATMSQDVTEVPVSLDVKSMGEYTISAKQKDCEYEVMTLVDKMTGVETNLLLEDYTFIATTKDRSDRFVIKLSNDNDDMTGNDNFAIVGKDNIIINNVNGHGLVKIFDVIGRPIAEYNVFESAMFSTSTFNSGVYFIQMSDENGVKVQKVIID